MNVHHSRSTIGWAVMSRVLVACLPCLALPCLNCRGSRCLVEVILKSGHEFRVPKMDKGFQSSTCVGVSSQIYDQASVQLQRCRHQSMRIRCLQLSPEILSTALKYTYTRTHARILNFSHILSRIHASLDRTRLKTSSTSYAPHTHTLYVFLSHIPTHCRCSNS